MTTVNQVFRIIKGSRGPALKIQVSKDISSATSKVFTMVSVKDGTIKVSQKAAAFITDGTDGGIQYSWAADDVDTVGDYYGWFEITLNSKIEKYPTDGWLAVKVIDPS